MDDRERAAHDGIELTRLLAAVRNGEEDAGERLLPAIYDELRSVAARELQREWGAVTATPTALVHEAWFKIGDPAAVDWQDRAHFLGVAAHAMRQVLVDWARRRKAEKRGGGWERTTLAGKDVPVEITCGEVLVIDELLDRLDALDPRQRQVVEMRFFAGMEVREVAAVLEVSERTVERDWVKARAWLHAQLEAGGGAQ